MVSATNPSPVILTYVQSMVPSAAETGRIVREPRIKMQQMAANSRVERLVWVKSCHPFLERNMIVTFCNRIVKEFVSVL